MYRQNTLEFETRQAPTLTWPQIMAIEPSLRHLKGAARWRGSWRRYEQLKAAMSRLVGWHARNPQLRDPDIYDTAHLAIFGRLGGRRRRGAR